MKLLKKVKEAGFNVIENKTQSGMRVIYISGKNAWIMCRIRPGKYSEIKPKIEFLQRSIRNILQ